MRMGQGVRTGLGHGGITCVLQTQFSSFSHHFFILIYDYTIIEQGLVAIFLFSIIFFHINI